jgi:hypothetical protein
MELKKIIFKKDIEDYNSNVFFILAFFLFVAFYLLNFDFYNDLYSNDFRKRYKPNGIIIINQILKFDLININFLNNYFIPELITGVLLKVFSEQLSFSIASNILNIILLFLSFKFFFKSLNVKNNYIIIIFLIFFFSYKGNWIYCFRKLPDIYFLFFFSIIFYFISCGISSKKNNYFFFALIFVVLSLFVRPQGFLNIFFLIGSYLTFILGKKINLIKLSFILFLSYLILFPSVVFILLKFDSVSILKSITQFMQIGKINGSIYYDLEKFTNEFSLSKNNFSEFLFYYYLFIKKLIYLFTFIREHYSVSHNSFLIIYVLNIYFFLILNFKNLYRKFQNFLELTIYMTLMSMLFHASLIIGSEPNRYQLFHLTPLYILVSSSIFEIVINKFKIFGRNKN